MDLVRRILLAVEQNDAFDGVRSVEALSIDGERYDTVAHHIHIMLQAGLLQATVGASFSKPGEPDWFGIRLTWQGSEFLDAVRNATVWNKVKAALVKAGGRQPSTSSLIWPSHT
jgi:hypothetical protein